MSLMFFAAAMGALLGVVTLGRGLGTGTSGSLNRSHDSSIGHNCWTARSRKDFPTLNLAPRTIPSLPLINFTTTPIFHLPLLRSSLCIKTTFLCSMGGPPLVWFRLCLYLKLLMYFPVHRDHRTSLQRRRYRARFLISLSSTESTSPSGNRLGWPNIMLWGVTGY